MALPGPQEDGAKNRAGFEYSQQAHPVMLCKSVFLGGPLISQQSGPLPTLVMKHGSV